MRLAAVSGARAPRRREEAGHDRQHRCDPPVRPGGDRHRSRDDRAGRRPGPHRPDRHGRDLAGAAARRPGPGAPCRPRCADPGRLDRHTRDRRRGGRRRTGPGDGLGRPAATLGRPGGDRSHGRLRPDGARQRGAASPPAMGQAPRAVRPDAGRGGGPVAGQPLARRPGILARPGDPQPSSGPRRRRGRRADLHRPAAASRGPRHPHPRRGRARLPAARRRARATAERRLGDAGRGTA